MEKQKTCCFIDNNPQNLSFGFNESDERCVKLKDMLKTQIVRMIVEKGVTEFISGMAIGVDTYAAEIVLELKEQYPQLWLECAIPCEIQAVKWDETDRERYYSILAQCDKDTMLQTHYTDDCMQKRNEYMVNKSEYVIAVWDGTESETANTVRYANDQNWTIVNKVDKKIRTKSINFHNQLEKDHCCANEDELNYKICRYI